MKSLLSAALLTAVFGLSIRINDIFCLLDVDFGLIICDANSTLEVHVGENVTISCTALPNVQYRWTKVRDNWLLLTSNPPSIWKVFMCYIILFCPRTRNCCQRTHLWSSRGWLMLTQGLTHWLSTQEATVCTKSLPSECSLQPQARWQVSFVVFPHRHFFSLCRTQFQHFLRAGLTI